MHPYDSHSSAQFGSVMSPLDYALNKRDEPIVETVRRAMESRSMILAYQPVVHANDSARPAFHEGLIRILDDNGEVLPAKDFVPICETMELGRYIDQTALELGLRTLAETPGLRLSINMSARSIGYPRWMETLYQGLSASPTIGERLILEITESSAMLIPDLVTVFMSDLRAKGISFALDDFGAGYTAFRFFKDFQFDIIKIDGSFIQGISNDPDNQVLASALMEIGKHFDMLTVAEMVETKEDFDYIQKLGIDCIQGYYTGRPDTMPEWRADARARFQTA